MEETKLSVADGFQNTIFFITASWEMLAETVAAEL